MKSRKYILIVLAFLTSLLCTVGASLWVVLTDKIVELIPYEKITPTVVTAPTISSSFYYGEEVTPTGGTVTANGKTISGTWSVDTYISASVKDSTTVSTTATCTFKPTESALYNETTKTINVTMNTVAYMGTTYYTTIDGALAVANDANTGKVFAMPITDYATQYKKTDGSDGTAVIARTITNKIPVIDPKVELILPYDGATYKNRENSVSATAFADAKESTYLKNFLSIADGHTLKNNGTIIVGGILGTITESGNQGHTSGNYAQINMGENSYIQNSGTIDCYGFIKETSKGKDKSFIYNTGTINAPFVIYDYRGPRHTIGAYDGGGVSPFSIYDMPNIYAQITTTSNAQINGYVDLFTEGEVLGGLIGGAQHNLEEIVVFYKSNAVINLADGATAIIDYSTTASPNYSSLGKTYITISGGASSGSLSLHVAFADLVNKDVDMSSILFPIPWKIDITLTNGTYELNTQYKFMPGSKLTVAESATANISDNIIFYSKAFYKSGYYPQTTDATFEINGTVNITGGQFGGYITTKKEKAILNISTQTLSCTSKEGTGNLDGLSGTFTETTTGTSASQTEIATADINNNGTINKDSELSTGFYQSNGSAWTLIANPRLYTVKLNYNYDNATESSYSILLEDDQDSVIVTDVFASDPVRAHWEFTGWYTDAACKNPIEDNATATSVGETITVYAGWKEIEYTLYYNVIYDDMTYSDTVYEPYRFYYSDTLNINLPTDAPTGSELTLVGWYLSIDDTSIRISNLDAANFNKYVDGDSIYLYARLTRMYTVTVNTGHEDLTVGDILVNAGKTITLPTLIVDDLHTDPTYQKQFTGKWYSDSNYTTEFTASTTVNSDMTIYGKWESKPYTVKVTLNKGSLGGDLPSGVTFNSISVTATTSFYLREGQSFTIKATNYASVSCDKISSFALGTSYPAQSCTVTITGENGCLVEGTLITLADGTQKKVEDITTNDIVLVFNHETGKVEGQKIAFNDHLNTAPALHRVLNLELSNGEILRLAGRHNVFDFTIGKYVSICEENMLDYIGHKFYTTTYNGNQFIRGEVSLIKAYITEEIVRVFSPVSEVHRNCFAQNVLTMTPTLPSIGEFITAFDFDENLKFDQEKLQSDIEKYGLYTYEDFKEYLTEEEFNSSFWSLLKIAVGKNCMTFEDIITLIEYMRSNGLM